MVFICTFLSFDIVTQKVQIFWLSGEQHILVNMHFLGIYKQELWERLNFVEAVQRRGMPFLIMQIHKK